MPRVPREWLNAVVYLYPTETDAKLGTKIGATAFIANVPVESKQLPPDRAHHYLVTNDHAVHARDSVAVRINLLAGGFDVLSIPAGDWTSHPEGDDLAVAPFAFDPSLHKHAAVNRAMMLTEELRLHWGFGPGDEVFFIGRYVDLAGVAHNAPTVRSGILSAYDPDEPIYQVGRDHHQEAFLIEGQSLSGFSGSPVFITPSAYVQPSTEFGGAPEVRWIRGGPCYLLGIDYAHNDWLATVMDAETRAPAEPHNYVRINSGMMMVVPAMKLLSLLDTAPLVARRREVERLVEMALGITPSQGA